jgi:hypothetical protein
MFYFYAQTVQHLVTIPGYLLSGSSPADKTAPKKAQKKEASQQRLTLKEIGLRRYLLERIEYCKRLKENKKVHTFSFAFETIAKDIGYEIDTPKRQRMLREQTFEFLQEQVKKKNITAVLKGSRCNTGSHTHIAVARVRAHNSYTPRFMAKTGTN